jgi:hypothetical protein
MRFVRQIFNFYLDASIHVGLAILCLVNITVIYFRITLDVHLALFVFFTTIASYNFIKYGVEAEKYVLVSSAYHRFIQLFSFIAVGLAAYHANYLSLKVWMVLGVLAVLVGLYSLPVLPQARKLRNLGIIKILLVGFVWGGTTVILPYLAVEDRLSWDVHVEALQRLVLVLVLMLPFEIRDMTLDDPSLRTIPQRYGVPLTKALGGIAGLGFLMLTFVKREYSTAELLGKSLVFLVLLLVLWRTKKVQSPYFASFWVEGVPILWLAFTLAVQWD